MFGDDKFLCYKCIHKFVCSLKDEYKSAQTTLNDIDISVGERSFKKLRDFGWIHVPELYCTHYMMEPIMKAKENVE